MKKLVALALGTVMAVSMTAGVSAATVESKDDLKNATIGVRLVQPVILKLVNMRLTEQLLSVTAKEAKQSRHLWPVRLTV